MSKRILLRNYASLKTAAILLALATGVFSSRADHFQWEDSSKNFSAPAGINSSDDLYFWVDSANCITNDVSTDGSTVYFSACLQAYSQIGTLQPYTAQAMHTGHSLSISGNLSDEITGEWVSDEDGPPVDATIDYTAHFTGTAYAETRVWQAINPSNGIGLINYFTIGANAGIYYYIDDMHLPSWVGDGYLTVGGGITNGLPNSSLGGGANYFAGEITPEYFLAEHTSDPDPYTQIIPSFNDEEWFYAQQVDYSVDVSDSYTADVDDVSLNPQLTVVSASNILLNTDEANWPLVRALADSMGFIEASISYTVTPNY